MAKSEPGFEEVIALAAVCLDETEKAVSGQRGSMTADDVYSHHLRVQKLYLDLCFLAAAHGNPTGQKMLRMIGMRLAGVNGTTSDDSPVSR